MLSNEIMGVLALGIVWLNTLLIAAHAWKSRATLGRTLAELREAEARGELVRAKVVRGHGEGGALAERRVTQVGRAVTKAGPDRILFTDKRSETRIAGGEVEVAGTTLAVAPAEGTVWIVDAPIARDPHGFDAAWSRAGTNKGVESELVIPVGSDVWMRGKRDGDRMAVELVSNTCPTTLLARARLELLGFALACVATVAGITALCLVRPVFGTVSAIGAALMVAFFLIVQPLGVRMQSRTRVPSERLVGGIWQRP